MFGLQLVDFALNVGAFALAVSPILAACGVCAIRRLVRAWPLSAKARWRRDSQAAIRRRLALNGRFGK